LHGRPPPVQWQLQEVVGGVRFAPSRRRPVGVSNHGMAANHRLAADAAGRLCPDVLLHGTSTVTNATGAGQTGNNLQVDDWVHLWSGGANDGNYQVDVAGSGATFGIKGAGFTEAGMKCFFGTSVMRDSSVDVTDDLDGTSTVTNAAGAQDLRVGDVVHLQKGGDTPHDGDYTVDVAGSGTSFGIAGAGFAETGMQLLFVPDDDSPAHRTTPGKCVDLQSCYNCRVEGVSGSNFRQSLVHLDSNCGQIGVYGSGCLASGIVDYAAMTGGNAETTYMGHEHPRYELLHNEGKGNAYLPTQSVDFSSIYGGIKTVDRIEIAAKASVDVRASTGPMGWVWITTGSGTISTITGGCQGKVIHLCNRTAAPITLGAIAGSPSLAAGATARLVCTADAGNLWAKIGD
jgi:hypothetical protein